MCFLPPSLYNIIDTSNIYKRERERREKLWVLILMMRGSGERGEKEEIRKGPWKAEEDEVLMNHVNKYGPRDWSSIRSKGLLQRTGKSCRLRWVNKLRPNLKNGCKFSLEEERVVIELQAQFGNKWARIATYLQGRTDNDVKNFWSSRQKRLARILQSPTSPPPPPPQPPSKPQKHTRQTPVFHRIPTLEAPKLNSAVDEESSSKASCSSLSPHIDNSEMIKMVPLPDLVNPLNYEANMCQLNFISTENNPCNEFQTPQITFPQIPQSEPELPFSPESQALVARLEDPNFMDVFGPGDDGGIGNGAQLPVGLACFELEEASRNGGREANGNPMGPDSFFDDFPTDMFDHIEPLPSPSEW